MIGFKNTALLVGVLIGKLLTFQVSAQINSALATAPETWRSAEMWEEPVLFIQQAGKATASGKLIFIPTANLEVKSPDGSVLYQLGKDYRWTSGSRMIELTESTRIPFKTAAEMAPGSGKPQTIAGVLHSEGRVFYDVQMMVSYRHAERIDGLIPVAAKTLARSLKKLREKKPFKVVALGDSITEGYNASGFRLSKAQRNQAPYAELFGQSLQQRFKTPVTVKNLAIAGKTAAWGLQMAGKVTEENPDLVILAFGMNDRVSPEQFQVTIRQLVAMVQAGSPDADIVLVSPMTDNPTVWKDGRIVKFRDALHAIDQPNVLHADVTTPWGKLLERKCFSDLSGNNINHPNDFGHRLYADVIGALFDSSSDVQLEGDEPASGLPRVLLMGDSISIGYTPYVKTLLRGKAEVIHHPSMPGPRGQHEKSL
jgi:acyl-CoA thioesterase-1